jgi:protein TonB
MSTQPRDILQRSIGCISFSAIAHSGLIAALLLSPSHGGDLVVISKAAGGSASAANSPVEVTALPQATTPTREIAVPPTKKTIVVVAPQVAIAKKISPSRALPATKRLKTVEQSSIVVESKKEKVELEELSPIIAEEPSSNTSAVVESSQEPSAVGQVAAATSAEEIPVEISEEISPPTTASEPESEPVQAAKQLESKDSVADNETGPAQGSGSGSTISGPGAAAVTSESDKPTVKPTVVVEASLRRPLAGNPLPTYPAQDRLRKHQGTAVVLGDVRLDGSIDNIRLDKSSGSREMDNASVSTFRRWKFAPGPEATVRKAFQFNLQGEAQIGYATLKR